GRRHFLGRHAARPSSARQVAAAGLPVVLLRGAPGARRLSRTAWSWLSGRWTLSDGGGTVQEPPSPRSVFMTVHALKKSNVATLRSKVSPEEWQARVDLAAAYRLIDLYGMSDLIANHISMRVPGEPDAFLINAYGLLYEEITASSLIKIDHEGNVLAKPDFGPGLDYGVNRAGFVIHSAIHMAKPDVNCVIHTHTWPGMAVSTMECGLLPNTQTSMRFAHISYHDFDGVVLDL